MGWLSMTRDGMFPHATPKAYLDDQFTYAPDPAKDRLTGLRVLKSSVRAGTWYAACQVYDADGPGTTFAAICLIHWNPAARDGYVFGYKDMSENMGPYSYDCPASILDLLGPPANDYAAKWREACRQRLALTSRRKPVPGDTLVLAEALTFTDGQSERSFRVAQAGRKIILRRLSDGAGVKISKLMSRAWTIVPAPSVPERTGDRASP
jgi:hypothetical protein